MASILLAEKNEEQRKALEEILRAYGHEVMAVADREEAKIMLKAATFNAAILGDNLGNYSGVNIILDMKQEGIHMPVVLRTNSTDYIAQTWEHMNWRGLQRDYSIRLARADEVGAGIIQALDATMKEFDAKGAPPKSVTSAVADISDQVKLETLKRLATSHADSQAEWDDANATLSVKLPICATETEYNDFLKTTMKVVTQVCGVTDIANAPSGGRNVKSQEFRYNIQVDRATAIMINRNITPIQISFNKEDIVRIKERIESEYQRLAELTPLSPPTIISSNNVASGRNINAQDIGTPG